MTRIINVFEVKNIPIRKKQHYVDMKIGYSNLDVILK